MPMKGPKEVYYRVGKSPFVYAGDQCNNRCIFCFEADREFPVKPLARLKKEVDIIRENFDFINLMGQEPTLREDLVELLNYVKRKNFRWFGITTNGRMFAYPDYAKKILASGLTQIGMTVMGHNPKLHDAHTLVKGSFEQTLAGLKNILHFKKKDVSLLLNIMVTKKNFRHLKNIVDFYADLGIKEMNIGHIMPLNRAIRDSKEIIAKISDVVPYLIWANDKYGDKIKFLFVEYPACAFPEIYRHLAFPCLEENPQKTRIKICNICEQKNKCNGITKSYIDLYGEDEFRL
jgi:MoaA/NifB/PqqE/SkfB family radical SAM enzyme